MMLPKLGFSLLCLPIRLVQLGIPFSVELLFRTLGGNLRLPQPLRHVIKLTLTCLILNYEPLFPIFSKGLQFCLQLRHCCIVQKLLLVVRLHEYALLFQHVLLGNIICLSHQSRCFVYALFASFLLNSDLFRAIFLSGPHPLLQFRQRRIMDLLSLLLLLHECMILFQHLLPVDPLYLRFLSLPRLFLSLVPLLLLIQLRVTCALLLHQLDIEIALPLGDFVLDRDNILA
mmetsp:Transcript_35645/g.70496  ORF Transcript_35645/g.70496 Transcript_35645/m.70496 type:complete len:230 (-) Transcript_35645:436-1125(-)